MYQMFHSGFVFLLYPAKIENLSLTLIQARESLLKSSVYIKECVIGIAPLIKSVKSATNILLIEKNILLVEKDILFIVKDILLMEKDILIVEKDILFVQKDILFRNLYYSGNLLLFYDVE